MNKQWVIGAIIGVTLSISGAALGQAQHPGRQWVLGGPAPEKPAEIARDLEVDRLDKVAAASLAAGQYAEAESAARQAIALGLDSGVAHEILASSLNAQGKEREALQVYQAMAYAHGDHARNLLPYSLLLLKAGRWASAVAAYDKALPDLADGNLVRANSHFSASAPRPTALAAAIHIALGLTYDSSDDWAHHSQRDRALQEFTKALQLTPSSPLTNFYYGYGLDELGRGPQAAAVFQRIANTASGAVKQAAEAALDRQRQAAYDRVRHDPLPVRIAPSGTMPSMARLDGVDATKYRFAALRTDIS